MPDLTNREIHGWARGVLDSLERKGVGDGDRFAVCLDAARQLVAARLDPATGAAFEQALQAALGIVGFD